MMKLIIDTLGADAGAKELILGTLDALKEHSFIPIFVGDREEIETILKQENYNGPYDCLHTTVAVSGEDKPTEALRQKKDASVFMAMGALEQADGLISCGATGALLAGATFITKRLEGIKRPCITLTLPTLKGGLVFLDAGANVDCTADMLLQFAQMASVYAQAVLGKDRPTVALLNNGAEEGKGDALRQESYELLRSSGLNFIGNIEARDLFVASVDIVVTDGFTGNAVLKTTEAVATAVLGILKPALKDTEDRAVLKAVGELKTLFDYNHSGAAPVLGVRKPVFKAHGASGRVAFAHGIAALIRFVSDDAIDKMKKQIGGQK